MTNPSPTTPKRIDFKTWIAAIGASVTAATFLGFVLIGGHLATLQSGIPNLKDVPLQFLPVVAAVTGLYLIVFYGVGVGCSGALYRGNLPREFHSFATDDEHRAPLLLFAGLSVGSALVVIYELFTAHFNAWPFPFIGILSLVAGYLPARRAFPDRKAQWRGYLYPAILATVAWVAPLAVVSMIAFAITTDQHRDTDRLGTALTFLTFMAFAFLANFANARVPFKQSWLFAANFVFWFAVQDAHLFFVMPFRFLRLADYSVAIIIRPDAKANIASLQRDCPKGMWYSSPEKLTLQALSGLGADYVVDCGTRGWIKIPKTWALTEESPEPRKAVARMHAQAAHR